MVQKRLVTARYHWKHPDRWHKLTPDHRCRHRVLADRPKIWNHQHWPNAIFDDGVSLYHSGRRFRKFHLFLGCNNPLAFQQHAEIFGHAHYSFRGWLWTHKQITRVISADGSSSGACVVYGGGSDYQWGNGLDILIDIKLLQNIFGLWGQRHGILFFWSSSTLIQADERKLFRHMIRRRAHSYFDVIIFIRCPGSPWVRLLLLVTLQWCSTSPSEKAEDVRTEQYFQTLQAGYWLVWLAL